jgi:4-cresol dehydrogenase (hydroxylating)
VVLPSGEVMRTGMGAMAGAKTWQEYKHGFGPDPAGLFAQGNLGIVTKMGIRLMPQPEHWRNGLITVPKRRDLIPLVKTVNYLTDLFMIGEPWYGSPLRTLMGNTEFREAATRRGGLNEAELDRLAAAAGLHAWQVELQFYGSEGTTRAGWEYAKELVAKAIPGARMTDGESLKVPLTRAQLENTTGPYPTNMRRNVTQGVPGLGVWYQTGRPDANSDRWNETHIGLFSVIPRSGEAVMASQEVFIDIGHEMGFPAGSSAVATPVNWHQFAFMMGNGFLTAQDFSPEGKKKQAALLRRIIETNAKHGWGDYRAPPVLQDAVAESYGWNNHVLRRFNETLKDAVDPNGIFSPGRGGIWPKAFRHLRGSFNT